MRGEPRAPEYAPSDDGGYHSASTAINLARSGVIRLILRGLIDHNIATSHEPYRDQHAGDGKEFDVAVHVNPDGG